MAFVPARSIKQPEALTEVPGECAIFCWQNIDVIVWTAPATAAGVRQMNAATGARAKALGTRVSDVHIVTSKYLALPDHTARAEFQRVGKEDHSHIACIGLVIEARGFVASSIRAFVTGLRIAGGMTQNTRMTDSIRGIADWLPKPHEAQTSVRLDRDELYRVLETVRGHGT